MDGGGARFTRRNPVTSCPHCRSDHQAEGGPEEEAAGRRHPVGWLSWDPVLVGVGRGVYP